MTARLTPAEFALAAERISKWPNVWRDDILHMEDNERRTLMLLAALLDAHPQSEGPAQK